MTPQAGAELLAAELERHPHLGTTHSVCIHTHDGGLTEKGALIISAPRLAAPAQDREALDRSPWKPAGTAPEGEAVWAWLSPNNNFPDDYGERVIAELNEGVWFDQRGEEIEAPLYWAPANKPKPPHQYLALHSAPSTKTHQSNGQACGDYSQASQQHNVDLQPCPSDQSSTKSDGGVEGHARDIADSGRASVRGDNCSPESPHPTLAGIKPGPLDPSTKTDGGGA